MKTKKIEQWEGVGIQADFEKERIKEILKPIIKADKINNSMKSKWEAS